VALRREDLEAGLRQGDTLQVGASAKKGDHPFARQKNPAWAFV
jgi:hypothetical protein